MLNDLSVEEKIKTKGQVQKNYWAGQLQEIQVNESVIKEQRGGRWRAFTEQSNTYSKGLLFLWWGN